MWLQFVWLLMVQLIIAIHLLDRLTDLLNSVIVKHYFVYKHKLVQTIPLFTHYRTVCRNNTNKMALLLHFSNRGGSHIDAKYNASR